MFERRLKIFFALLAGITLVVLLRAAHLQVVNGGYYREQASRSMVRTSLIETVRGSIVDVKGRVLATDEPCIDAAVDYRAIEKNTAWARDQALARVGTAYRAAPREQRPALLKDETDRVLADIDAMWAALASVSGKRVEDIEQIKNAIHRKVDMRRRYLWYKKYEQAVEQLETRTDKPWYEDWKLARRSDPELDSFRIDVAEQSEAHVILSNISPEAHNHLKKSLERFPGLVLRPSKHRFYPYASAASHVIGNLSSVTGEDLRGDPNDGNELLEYYPNDAIGRSGVEALCETALRGSRGRIERSVGRDDPLSQTAPRRGRDVRITLDIELQAQLEAAFQRVEWYEKGELKEAHLMHGAAVVIDVPTGQVRALVSVPTFDLNRFDDLYATLVADQYNRPLVNRALQAQYEPGSTAKPIVGAGAVSQGILKADDGVECTGYLIVNGRKIKTQGRCWTASRFERTLPDMVPHHKLPTQDPHPTGFLTLADALQRSCNIFFQDVGIRMGLEGVAFWFDQFGLGRRTGIGLPETPGRIPRLGNVPSAQLRSSIGFSSIGQGQVVATPIQMANVAATIARNGEWVRPAIVASAADVGRPSTRPAAPPDGPDRRKLPLTPEAIAAVREGMTRVVNTRAGTGNAFWRDDILLAAKTGTAQAPPFYVVQRDADGKPLRDPDGNVLRTYPPISTRESPNPELPWYRGSGSDLKQLHHAWAIGYAPADNPRIAFCVMLEYGGSGGHDAAPVVRALLDALVEHGYLERKPGN